MRIGQGRLIGCPTPGHLWASMHKTIYLDPDRPQRTLVELTETIDALLDQGKRLAVTVAEEDELLSPQQAATRLGFSRQHVRRLMEAGELEGRRLPNSDHWKVPLRSVLDFEDRRTHAEDRADELSRELDRRGAPAE